MQQCRFSLSVVQDGLLLREINTFFPTGFVFNVIVKSKIELPACEK